LLDSLLQEISKEVKVMKRFIVEVGVKWVQ